VGKAEGSGMAIRSEKFGGVQLTGKDADAFERQVKEGKVTREAQRALEHGAELLSRFNDFKSARE